jgi:hypothetical protein
MAGTPLRQEVPAPSTRKLGQHPFLKNGLSVAHYLTRGGTDLGLRLQYGCRLASDGGAPPLIPRTRSNRRSPSATDSAVRQRPCRATLSVEVAFWLPLVPTPQPKMSKLSIAGRVSGDH